MSSTLNSSQYQRRRDGRARVSELDHHRSSTPRKSRSPPATAVADATDDGAAYAVAQRVRSDVGALTTANQQLGGVQGLLSTTQTRS